MHPPPGGARGGRSFPRNPRRRRGLAHQGQSILATRAIESGAKGSRLGIQHGSGKALAERRTSAVALALCSLACTGQPHVEPADRTAFAQHLRFPDTPGGPPRFSDPTPIEGGTLLPVRLPLWPGFDAHGALLRPTTPVGAGVVVAQGHFGEGKSSPEAQEIALQLVQRGATVVLIDTPGMEEADRPGRHIHFDDGAHNRAFLAAGGTSAMALQLALLQRGVDLLENEGATRIGATGASGGAVQSLYLGLIDDRIDAVALASFPPTPREARAGGCPCDQVPGWPGPDPTVSAALAVPSLWLSDGPAAAPKGLPRNGTHVQTEGPHSYTPEMQRHALAFFADHLKLAPGDGLGPAPIRPIRTDALTPADLDLFDLRPHLTPTATWSPGRQGEGHHEVSCSGTGPVVAVAGGDDTDQAALVAAGLRACLVRIPEDAVGHDVSIGTGGTPYTHVLSGALAAAADRISARAIYSKRGFALVAAGTGLPYAVLDPIRTLDDLRPTDPTWIHVRGAWWGALEPVWQGALIVASDRPAVVSALQKALTEAPAPPSP